jgi:hypothetical protein
VHFETAVVVLEMELVGDCDKEEVLLGELVFIAL